MATAACAAAVILSGAAPAQAATQAELDEFVAGLGSRVDLSRVHLSIVDLKDPARPVRAGWRDRDYAKAASIIKLALLAGAYQAAQENGLSFDRKVVIDKRNWTGTWAPPGDPDPPLQVGAAWTVGKLVEVMVRRSDNVATNTLIDVLRRERVTRFVQSLGCPDTLVRHKLSSGNTVDDPEATGGNLMLPRDAATLLMRIARQDLLGAEPSRRMLATLRGQLDRDLIAAGIGPDAEYAGKTGELSDARNDAAIVKGPDRHYVLVVYASLPDGPAQPLIRRIAREVDGFFAAN